MHKSVLVTLAALLGGASTIRAADFADEVISYISGVGASPYTDPTTALGPAAGFAGGYVVSAFEAPYEPSQFVEVGAGGELTLRLSNYVAVVPRTLGIGVFSVVGLTDVSPTYTGLADSVASSYSNLASSVVEVSADNVHWYSLNGGNQVSFGMPTNYFANGGPYDGQAPDPAVYSDFGKPYAGTRADFANETYSQILTTLDGSAGGTWLSLDGLPEDVTQVDYIRFSDVPAGEELKIDAVSTNTALTLAPAPEPGSAGLLVFAGVLALGVCRMRGKSRVLPAFATGAIAMVGAGGFGQVAKAQTVESFSDITNWVGTGVNSAALVIDWNDGLTYPGESGGQTLVWGYHWNGTATGEQMFDAIVAADPRLILNPTAPPVPNVVYGIGYDLDGGGFTYVPGPMDTGSSLDPNDHYQEGFEFAGYWQYWLDASPTTSLPTWVSSTTGYTQRNLVNNSWDGWTWDSYALFPDFNGNPPGPAVAAIAAPEPATAALLVCGAVLAARPLRPRT